MIDIHIFLKNISDQFDETDPATLALETEFKTLDDYSSLTALNIISMIDDEYDVILKGEDIRSSNTIQDLYNIVNSKV